MTQNTQSKVNQVAESIGEWLATPLFYLIFLVFPTLVFAGIGFLLSGGNLNGAALGGLIYILFAILLPYD